MAGAVMQPREVMTIDQQPKAPDGEITAPTPTEYQQESLGALIAQPQPHPTGAIETGAVMQPREVMTIDQQPKAPDGEITAPIPAEYQQESVGANPAIFRQTAWQTI
ncbi:protein of unknown function [Methylotuvimicrobium alcaliphilum 20Z]|uniref:Uncharacterized protein n=1 Tax=Methylotuvimicrobium alcaliphilum (strain DSM 19304 / NCIMB 14124 / VKM B-2133 / 20Z) TaxID=1091494 RepID=G4SVN7_META2|nr:protein of unknown function [Methylotuvimicrobium alcaliphilum 20Z]